MKTDHVHFAEWDAAYVLGALSPAERREFEDHIDECDKCRAAVTELSAIPGLLGRIDDARAFALLEQADADPDVSVVAGPPADLVARIQRRERRDRLRRRFGMGAALAAAAAVAAVLALVLPPALTPPVQPTLAAELTPNEAGTPIEASIGLTSVSWGTRIDMDCSYHPVAGPDGGYAAVEYALWVVDRAGAESQLSTWSVGAAGTVTISAGTALAIGDIAEIEVRSVAGDRVLLSTDVGSA